MKLKTIEQIFKESLVRAGRTDYFYPNQKDINEDITVNKKFVINNFAKHLIEYVLNYASENVEIYTDYHGKNFEDYCNVMDVTEVYVPKGEFDKIKELIK